MPPIIESMMAIGPRITKEAATAENVLLFGLFCCGFQYARTNIGRWGGHFVRRSPPFCTPFSHNGLHNAMFLFAMCFTLVWPMAGLAASNEESQPAEQQVNEIKITVDKAVESAFLNENTPELMIVAGTKLCGMLDAKGLSAYVARLIDCPSPLPACVLGPLSVKKFTAGEIRKLLTTSRAIIKDSAQRNLCILLGCVPDSTLAPPLFQIYSSARNRAVKLEAISALGKIRDVQAVKALQSIFSASKDVSERAACLRSMATSAAETDVPWIFQQLATNSRETIEGAWTIARLTQILPFNEVKYLLGRPSRYGRRAGLLLMKKMGTPEQWMELLKTSSNEHPETLAALGRYFESHPVKDAAIRFLALQQNCAHKDFCVADAWCKGLGACAALADAPLQSQAFTVLANRTAPMLQVLSKAQQKPQREAAISAIYGLEALGHPQARTHLAHLALHGTDEIAALYAAAGLLHISDPSVALQFRQNAEALRGKGREPFIRSMDLMSLMPQREVVEFLFESLASAPDDPCRMAARDALVRLTGHDFGPNRSVWTEWWRASKFEFFENKIKKIHDTPIRPDASQALKSASDDVATLDFSILRKNNAWSLARFGGDYESEAAVAAGLRWLAEHQDPDGKWDGRLFTDLNITPDNDADKAIHFGQEDINISLTGLALLAFLASNHTHLSQQSIYRETVSRALEWLKSRQQDDGGLEDLYDAKNPTLNSYGYSLAIATLAFSEAYAMTHDAALKEAAQAGLDKIQSNQTPGDGWRYVPRISADTSIVGWMVMAQKSGLLAGLNVDARTRLSDHKYFDNTCSRMKEYEDPKDTDKDYEQSVGERYKDEEAFGSYMGNLGGGKMTASAIAGGNRIFLGYSRTHPFSVGVANLLRRHLPRWAGVGVTAGRKKVPEGQKPKEPQKPEERNFPIYYLYYGTLFMHQMGGKDWIAWNAAMKRALLEGQIKAPHPAAGSFPAIGYDGIYGGQVYSTAMCVLTLETYYRYLPMLWLKE